MRRGDQPSAPPYFPREPSLSLWATYVITNASPTCRGRAEVLSDDGGPERASPQRVMEKKDRAILAHARLRTHCASAVPCMYVRGNYVRTYVHACVRTCVVRTYAEVGHAVLPVLAAPCVPVVDASTCVPDVPVVPVPGVPDRTYVRMYVRTYVSERGHPAAKGEVPSPLSQPGVPCQRGGLRSSPPFLFSFFGAEDQPGLPFLRGGLRELPPLSPFVD